MVAEVSRKKLLVVNLVAVILHRVATPTCIVIALIEQVASRIVLVAVIPHLVATGEDTVAELARNKLLLVVFIVAAILHRVATRACAVIALIE